MGRPPFKNVSRRISITICTDHDALHWILNMTEKTEKLACWHLRLSEFEFDVMHTAGINLREPDALSWLTTAGIDDKPLHDDVTVPTIRHHFTSDDISPILVITNGRYGWYIKSSADKTDIFTLGWKDTGNMDGANYNHILGLSEVYQIADSPDPDRAVTTIDFIIN